MRVKGFIFTLIFATIASVGAAYAQRPIRLSVRTPEPPDSADVEFYTKPHFWRAAGLLTGFNLGIWAYDRYALNADYARISAHSIADNFKHGFVWDNDQMGTNMFAHPYHGGLYFNSARSNGFNFWQSGMFALAGSAMWEMVLENEYPSINDIIATPVGGCAIGEITYRTADIVLLDNSTGWERFGRELAAFAIAPTRGLTRIINGNAWRVRETTGRQFGVPNVAVEISAGARLLELKRPIFDDGLGGVVQLNLEYGDRFDIPEHHLPYDYFRLNAQLNIQKGQPLFGQFNLTGRLLAHECIDSHGRNLNVGLYQHFDYYDSDTISAVAPQIPYKLGVPASVGAGLFFRDRERGSVVFDAYAHINGVPLGAVASDHYHVDMRDYNLAMGYNLKCGFAMVASKGKFSLSADYDFYRLYTWDGYPEGMNLARANPHTLNVMGDKSVASFGVGSVRAEVRLRPHLYLTAQGKHYYRSTRYAYNPDVRTSSFTILCMLTYKL